mmetsp:Transcript_25666/g.49992  ORF Transcript_25666/g.49992 Transcript_25666/m.49992 type:complete len:153 (+) Transcript_25666:132-590(+)
MPHAQTIAKRIQTIGFARNAEMKIIPSGSLVTSANFPSQARNLRWDTHLLAIHHNHGTWVGVHHRTVMVIRHKGGMECLKVVMACRRRVVIHRCHPTTATDIHLADIPERTIHHLISNTSVHPLRAWTGLPVSVMGLLGFRDDRIHSSAVRF